MPSFKASGIIGNSAAFVRTLETVPLVSISDLPVFIEGETGTGKELVARAIHYNSSRVAKPFVPFNCGAVPEGLFENELFGHAKGAYTHAWSTEKGLVVEAEGGTLFLDEIDGLSASAQVKLLRFLDDGHYRPLGSTSSKTANVRILAASNADLHARIEVGAFRKDLFYRISVLSIKLPPLRERGDDILLLANYFLDRSATKHGYGSLILSVDAIQKLFAYHWPGNVRELEAVIQRAVIMHSSPTLQPEDIELPLSFQNGADNKGSLKQAKQRVVTHFEQTYLIEVLSKYEGNITRAATSAGKERRSFKRLLQKYGLRANNFRRLILGLFLPTTCMTTSIFQALQ